MAALGRDFGAAFYEREARFLMRDEWAETETSEDILERLTKHGLHLDAASAAAFGRWLALERAVVCHDG